MAAVSLRLPNSIYNMAKELSQEDQVFLNQFIVTAVSEKVSAMTTQRYIAERATHASKEKFLEALDTVADREPLEYDQR